MRKTVLISGIVSLVVLVGLGILFLVNQQKKTISVTKEVTVPASPTQAPEVTSEAERITVLAQHLDTLSINFSAARIVFWLFFGGCFGFIFFFFFS